MQRPTIGFIGNQLCQGTPRGALRLFRAIAAELAERNDLNVVVLGDFVSSPSDPIGCTYIAYAPRDWFQSVLGVANAQSPLDSLIKGLGPISWRRRFERVRDIYRRNAPETVQYALRPVVSRLRRVVATARHRGLIGRGPYVWGPLLTDSDTASNESITGKVVSLEQVDVLIDFWWFHLPDGSELSGRYRPHNLRVYGWFLDAIPLRVDPGASGQIPPDRFRAVLQPHLESLDEILAISACDADDLRMFFPHLAGKPVHVVPCGIFESDFIEADSGAHGLSEDASVASEHTTFCAIGATEPTKNFLNALRALAIAARTSRQRIHLAVIGSMRDTQLASVLGPYATELDEHVEVKFLGAVSEAVKRKVLANSLALIYPSKWEGFGIPPLEAMAAGVQVVTSDIPTAREFYGGLAELCDPYDVGSISEAILRVMCKTPSEVSEWRSLARAHAKKFLWAASADLLARSLVEASHSSESARRGCS